MKQWSRWSSRKGVPQWDMFPGPTELLFVGCSIELIWTPRSKSNTLTPKNHLADMLTKGSFTRDEWNHLSCLFKHHPFQFCRVFWSDVEKNTERFRWRKSHSKVEADDEFGLAMQWKDSRRAIYYWIPAILLFGRYSTTMQTWIVWRHWFCRRLSRLKINTRRHSVAFSEVTRLCQIVGCAEQQTSVSHSSTEAEIIFSRCRFYHGRYSRSHSLGLNDWSISFRTEQNRWTQERAMEKPVGKCQAKHA